LLIKTDEQPAQLWQLPPGNSTPCHLMGFTVLQRQVLQGWQLRQLQQRLMLCEALKQVQALQLL
jgi:hypothetical protein